MFQEKSTGSARVLREIVFVMIFGGTALLLRSIEENACLRSAEEILRLEEECGQLEERREMLQVTVRNLTSLSRVEGPAREAGLVPPSGAEVVYVVAPAEDRTDWTEKFAGIASKIGDMVLPVRDAYAFE